MLVLKVLAASQPASLLRPQNTVQQSAMHAHQGEALAAPYCPAQQPPPPPPLLTFPHALLHVQHALVLVQKLQGQGRGWGGAGSEGAKRYRQPAGEPAGSAVQWTRGQGKAAPSPAQPVASAGPACAAPGATPRRRPRQFVSNHPARHTCSRSTGWWHAGTPCRQLPRPGCGGATAVMMMMMTVSSAAAAAAAAVHA